MAEKVVVPQSEKTEIDYGTLSTEVAEKIAVPTFDILVDDAGAERIAEAVAEKMRGCCPAAQQAEPVAEETTAAAEEPEPIEESAEESVEENIAAETEPVEEETIEEAPAEAEQPEETAVEETAEETVEAAAEEAAVGEEPAENAEEAENGAESAVATEIAFAEAEVASYEEIDNNLVDADTGLVILLKRSFTAKMKQSEPEVKEYYSRLKNELTSYKKLNSNLSWHGDRFNFGRDTVAKINICGKTLCFYLALDPNDPEYKPTIYHQKDVSAQKAYENTPFMVKVKSDAGAKKALRLITSLAEKLETTKRDNFEAVDYSEEFAHESTKQLLEKGLIKVTKEKKVVLDFN